MPQKNAAVPQAHAESEPDNITVARVINKVVDFPRDGGVAKTGLKHGDLIVGINGVAFIEYKQIKRLWNEAFDQGGKCTLSILRAGRPMDLSFNGDFLNVELGVVATLR